MLEVVSSGAGLEMKSDRVVRARPDNPDLRFHAFVSIMAISYYQIIRTGL